MSLITVQNHCGCEGGKDNFIKVPIKLVFKPFSDLRKESFMIKLADNMEY